MNVKENDNNLNLLSLNCYKMDKLRTIKKGLPKTLFITNENILNNFICPICNLIVIKPNICGLCNILYCEKCLLLNNKCPNCSVQNIGNIPRIIKNILSNLKLKCIFYKNGCEEICSYENINKHISNCKYGFYHCNDCNFIGNFFQIEKHFYECQFNKIKCNFCGIEILKNKKNEHEKKCINQFTICKRCGYKISNFDYEEHIKNCEYIIYDCEFCGRSYIQKKFDEHNCIGYLKKLKKFQLKKIECLENKIKTIDNKIKYLKKKKKNF
jgi:hypothetical protein